MKKTILSFVMMLTMVAAMAGPTITAHPAGKATPTGKPSVEFKGDTLVVNDGDEQVTVSGIPALQKVRDKIDQALDDTLATGSGTTVEIGNHHGDLSPEDIKYMSDHWGQVAKDIALASILGLLGLVLLVLFFRFLNRRNKYRVIEKAIENNYPLNELSLNDTKRSAIYVQQPVVTAAPPMPGAPAAAAPNAGGVPVGTPIQGQTAANPIVMTDMVNWRAMMPAVKWIGWGTLLVLFSVAIGDAENPFWPIGLALIFVGVCKGFLLYKEQKALQEAWKRGQMMPPQSTPVREGTPMPPPLDEDYREDDSNTCNKECFPNLMK